MSGWAPCERAVATALSSRPNRKEPGEVSISLQLTPESHSRIAPTGALGQDNGLWSCIPKKLLRTGVPDPTTAYVVRFADAAVAVRDASAAEEVVAAAPGSAAADVGASDEAAADELTADELAGAGEDEVPSAGDDGVPPADAAAEVGG